MKEHTTVAVAALALYVIWFALAFGARTVIALRRTGDSGWRGISGRPFTVEWFAGIGFTVALIVGIAAPVAALAGVDPLIDSTVLAWAGTAIAAAGIALTLVAQLSMGDSWRSRVDDNECTDLVTDGAFSVARNPIFTAMVVTAAGLTVMVPNVAAAAGFIALLAARPRPWASRAIASTRRTRGEVGVAASVFGERLQVSRRRAEAVDDHQVVTFAPGATPIVPSGSTSIGQSPPFSARNWRTASGESS